MSSPFEQAQCLEYALNKWYDEGGYLMFRKSDHWFVPHALHQAKDGTITHFVPKERTLKKPWYSLFGFDGEVVVADPSPAEKMPWLGMFVGTLLLLILGGLWALRRFVIYRT